MSPTSSYIVSNDQVHWVLRTTPGQVELRLGAGLHQGVHACHKAQLQGSGASTWGLTAICPTKFTWHYGELWQAQG